jgi:hypothetical protein
MERSIEFEIGMLFPPDDRIARWMTVCCIALNDTLPSSVRLTEQLEHPDVPAWSNVYLIRLVASHLHEAGKFLAESERKLGTELTEFLGGLSMGGRRDYETVKSLWPGNQGEFGKRLRTLRNHFFHYAEMLPHAEDYESLRGAITRLTAHNSRIVEGKYFKDFRAEFADDVATELAFAGDAGLREFVLELSETVAAFMNFFREALRLYIDRSPSGSYRVVSP